MVSNVKPENVRFFDSAADFRAWLQANHDTADHQWVGFYKKAAERTAMPYPDAVEEALCFGWIDGQLSGIDELSHAIRFTPRRAGSIWSNLNVRRMQSLIDAGRVYPAGTAAFEARRADRTGVYSSENPPLELTADLERRFLANEAAWDFWNRQPQGYRRQMTWWVMTAKRDETRLRRVDALIAQHATGQRIDPTRLPKMSVQ
jgi:uncharacterized protein YdeI (YjbR/CyaY-like superfamily)